MFAKIAGLLSLNNARLRASAISSLQAIFLKSGSSLLAFFFTLVMARLASPEFIGSFYFAFSVVLFFSLVCRMGMDISIVRMFSESEHGTDRKEASTILGSAAYLVIVRSIIANVFVFAALFMGLAATQKYGSADNLLILVFCILPFSVIQLYSEAMRGLDKVQHALFIQNILIPAFSLTFIYPFYSYMGESGISLAYLLACLCASAVAALGVSRLLEVRIIRLSEGMYWKRFNELKASGRNLFWTILINRMVFPWFPVIILGFLSTPYEAGLYAVINRLSNIISLMLATVNGVLAPKFSNLYGSKKYEELKILCRKMALLLLLVTLPLFLLMFFNSKVALGLFGDEYKQASFAFVIMLFAHLISLVCGSPSTLLMMTGSERQLKLISAVSAIILTGVCIWLSSEFGHLGAAIAFSLAYIFRNIACVVLVRKSLGFFCTPSFR